MKFECHFSCRPRSTTQSQCASHLSRSPHHNSVAIRFTPQSQYRCYLNCRPRIPPQSQSPLFRCRSFIRRIDLCITQNKAHELQRNERKDVGNSRSIPTDRYPAARVPETNPCTGTAGGPSTSAKNWSHCLQFEKGFSALGPLRDEHTAWD